jgi:hypothetical protein
MPKGFISRASSDYVERADKWLIPVKWTIDSWTSLIEIFI